VLFRFFPDGTQLGALQEGEVALFPQCNYQGKAVVFALDTPNLAALQSSLFALAQIGSIKLGNNTGVILYPEAGYQGTRQIVEADTPCLNTTITASLQVRPLAPTLLLSSKACQKCQLGGVDLSGLDLSGYDLSGSLLAGAHLNNANLAGATLQGAFLSSNADVSSAAQLTGAYLKNVNLAGANLTSAILDDVSFYGTLSTRAGSACTIESDGFTADCASAKGATLTNTKFNGAYLYGVDFGGAKVEGTVFNQAVLIGANFSEAQFVPVGGSDADFTAAFIQGTTFPTSLSGTTFQDAFVDFSAQGNTMELELDASHTRFPGWKTPNQAVCVQVSYGGKTVVPPRNQTLTCPDGSAASDNTPPGCGPLIAGNPHWASPANIATANPAASYQSDSTYVPAAATPVCSPPDPDW
jgi:uncharacterized protein YjbI with pentapeptide repeats